jgi:hypothetical protein
LTDNRLFTLLSFPDAGGLVAVGADESPEGLLEGLFPICKRGSRNGGGGKCSGRGEILASEHRSLERTAQIGNYLGNFVGQLCMQIRQQEVVIDVIIDPS